MSPGTALDVDSGWEAEKLPTDAMEEMKAISACFLLARLKSTRVRVPEICGVSKAAQTHIKIQHPRIMHDDIRFLCQFIINIFLKVEKRFGEVCG